MCVGCEEWGEDESGGGGVQGKKGAEKRGQNLRRGRCESPGSCFRCSSRLAAWDSLHL